MEHKWIASWVDLAQVVAISVSEDLSELQLFWRIAPLAVGYGSGIECN
jgi:hypothetical protein